MSLPFFISNIFKPQPKVDFSPPKKSKKQSAPKSGPPPVPQVPPIANNIPKHLGSSTLQNNPSLLKQAIDDAKTVRATALANAKTSLDDAFKIATNNNTKYNITFADENGNFDEIDVDWSSALSGNMDIDLGAPANMPNYASMFGGTRSKDSHGNPTPEFTFSGAVGEQPEPRTGNIARVQFEVIIGRPQWSKQVYSIKNSQGKEIYLASNQSIVKTAVEKFQEQLVAANSGYCPSYVIKSGTMFRTGLNNDIIDPILEFHGLKFPAKSSTSVGSRIMAEFTYGENNSEIGRKEVEDILKIVGSTCEFYILGEIELDEDGESMTEMVIESFGYTNKNRTAGNEELVAI